MHKQLLKDLGRELDWMKRKGLSAQYRRLEMELKALLDEARNLRGAWGG